ncbi:MAG TPA: ADOP family duplicated permease [Bryobacteraceae bacterium]|nr:ADOP family duplicated permease [Bryobacteraceae bacterium]
MLNALILRPLNVPHAESLYCLEHGNEHALAESYPDYLDLRDRDRTFEHLAAWTIAQAGLDTGENASRAWLILASGNYFDALQIQPYIGRFFHASDERGPNSAPYIVLTYDYWRSRFLNGRGVVGRTVRLNKHPFTIIGVAPPSFYGASPIFSPDFFVPIVNEAQVSDFNYLNDRGSRAVFMLIGRLKAGVTPVQAIGDLNSIGRYLQKTYPKEQGETTFALGRPVLFGDFLGRPARAFLSGLMLLSGLILLAACMNLGNLFAARAAERAREVALRLALGASRTLVMRGLLVEAMLLSIAGGIVGLQGSIVLLRALSAWRPLPRFPVRIPVSPDAHVYLAALLLVLLSAVLFGIVPARQVFRTDPYQIIKSGSRGTSGRYVGIRDLLLALQIAICAVLVTSSMVALRGLIRSLHSHFGFEPENVMLVETSLDMAGYRGDAVPAMQRRIIRAMEEIPGVTSVGLIDEPPLGNGSWRDSPVFTDEATDLRPSNAIAVPVMYRVSPGYFRAAGTALLAGRSFTWHDDQSGPRMAVINREFARKLFGSVPNAIRRHYKMPDGARVEVVGVVEDGKYKNLVEEPQPAMFFPLLQSPSSHTTLVARSSTGAHIAALLRRALRNLDPGLPCYIQTWNEALNLPLFPSRVATVSLSVLGGMAAMLSVTGIVGLAAYSVSKRKRELGIRMALGAQREHVLRAALGRVFQLLGLGSAAGLILGMLASRVLASIVYQASPRDPLVMGGAVFTMLLLGLAATWIPAQRALSVEPSILLREE